MTAKILSFAEGMASRARVAETREMLAVVALIRADEVIPLELAQKHDIDQLKQWILEIDADDS